MQINQALSFEIRRKLFHLAGLTFPLIYIFVDKLSMSVFLLIILTFTLYLDISRHYNPKIKGVIENIFAPVLRIKEKSGNFALSGASYMAAGLFLTCLLFSKGLTVTSWFILIISDGLAAILGLLYGTKLANGKSLVGGGVFLFSSILISIISYFMINYNTKFIIIILSSALTSIVEFYSDKLRIDDNLSIPLTYCLSTVILGLIF